MDHMGFIPLLIVLFIAYVIPIAAAILVVFKLSRVRSDIMTIKGELEEIKRLHLK